MFRKRRKIRYYNGPAYAEKLTQKVWFPFAAVAVAALVLGLVIGLILSAVSAGSKQTRLPKRELTDFGGVESPSEKYAPLLDIEAKMIDVADMSESEMKKAISGGEGNAVGLLLFDGTLHYNSHADVGYEELGSLDAQTIALGASGKSRYSVGLFLSRAFEEKDTAKRAYEKGRELALLAEIADAGFREILIFGLPSDESLLSEVSLFLAQVNDFSPHTNVGVVLDGGASDAELARLVAASETSADSFALDLRDMETEEAADAVERNAYFLTQYHMRTLLKDNEAVTSAYALKSFILWESD
ncbi:MAG: hypothetical protein J6B12_00585 [Clostridia bacterium]|nr:hypothetical protein [Clostridia bacterium]